MDGPLAMGAGLIGRWRKPLERESLRGPASEVRWRRGRARLLARGWALSKSLVAAVAIVAIVVAIATIVRTACKPRPARGHEGQVQPAAEYEKMMQGQPRGQMPQGIGPAPGLAAELREPLRGQ